MAHLTDKPLGLQKMQREIKLLQLALANSNDKISELIEIKDKLEAEIKRLSQIVDKKNQSSKKLIAAGGPDWT
jgi:hypothetical protein